MRRSCAVLCEFPVSSSSLLGAAASRKVKRPVSRTRAEVDGRPDEGKPRLTSAQVRYWFVLASSRTDAVTGSCANTSPVPKSDPMLGAESPEELPAYTPARAAQIVRLSSSTLRLWARGDGKHTALFAPRSE